MNNDLESIEEQYITEKLMQLNKITFQHVGPISKKVMVKVVV